jgi:hypothetical protein
MVGSVIPVNVGLWEEGLRVTIGRHCLSEVTTMSVPVAT